MVMATWMTIQVIKWQQLCKGISPCEVVNPAKLGTFFTSNLQILVAKCQAPISSLDPNWQIIPELF
jgi:hypothetical protein